MDRVGLLHQLATLPEHPESVPINALVAVKGTPLQVRDFKSPPGAKDSAPMMLLILKLCICELLATQLELLEIETDRMRKRVIVQDQAPPSALEIIRCIATARVVMPRSVVRLSAGRLNFSRSDQVQHFPKCTVSDTI